MRAVIVGANRCEVGIFRDRDLDKHFYETRGQGYRFYPQEVRQI